MALFTRVQHLGIENFVIRAMLSFNSTTFMYLLYSHPLIYHLLTNVWKASYTITASIFVDVPYWSPCSTDKFISCVVPDPPHWFFHFGDEIVLSWNQEKRTTLGGTEPHHSSGKCKESHRCYFQGPLTPLAVGDSWNIHRSHLIWAHETTVSSSKWKNHSKLSDTTQEINLSMLEGGQYGTQQKWMRWWCTNNAFQTFGNKYAIFHYYNRMPNRIQLIFSNIQASLYNI